MTTIKFALQMRQDRSKGDWGLRGHWLKTGPSIARLSAVPSHTLSM